MKGIYKITNIKNGKVYIGQSRDIERRWEIHKGDLMIGVHHSKKLQNDFDKQGKNLSDFEFSVVKKCKKDMLDVFESIYAKQMKSEDESYGYNTLRFCSFDEENIAWVKNEFDNGRNVYTREYYKKNEYIFSEISSADEFESFKNKTKSMIDSKDYKLIHDVYGYNILEHTTFTGYIYHLQVVDKISNHIDKKKYGECV